MDAILSFLGTAGPPVILLVVGFALLRALGPADWSLFRQRPDESWPHGVQEEDPRPWDFGAPEAGAALAEPTLPVRPGGADDPPAVEQREVREVPTADASPSALARLRR